MKFKKPSDETLNEFLKICRAEHPGYIPDFMFVKKWGTVPDYEHVTGLVWSFGQDRKHTEKIKEAYSLGAIGIKDVERGDFIKVRDAEFMPKRFFSMARVLGAPFQRLRFYVSKDGFLVVQNESNETGVISPLQELTQDTSDSRIKEETQDG